MEEINLKKGFYALCQLKNRCCDTLEEWDSEPILYRFDTYESREVFVNSYFEDNQDMETFSKVKLFEIED